MSPLLSISQVAERLAIGYETARRLVLRLEHVKFGRNLRVSRVELERYIREATQPPCGETSATASRTATGTRGSPGRKSASARRTGRSPRKSLGAWREALDPAAKPRRSTALLDAAAMFMDGQASQLSDGSVDYYTKRFRQLVAGIGSDVKLDDLTRAQVEAHFNRRRLDVSDHTVSKEAQALRRLLRIMAAHNLFHGDADAIVPSVKPRYVPRDRWLTADECAALLGQLSPRWRLWVQIAVYTGARKSEVERLRWGHVNFRQQVVAIPRTKTDEADRRVPLAAPLAAALRRTERSSGPIVGVWSKAVQTLARSCKRAEIAKVTPNDLRRTYASWLLQQGCTPFVVAKLLGHKSLKMVMRVYGQLGDRELQNAVKTLPEVTPRPTIVRE